LANQNEALYGIVNGTSNFILTEMVEKGKTYREALDLAGELGLAEADPTLDVNGMDAAHKLTILATLAFGEKIPLEKISVEGIDKINLMDVKTGSDLGYVLKLVAFARKTKTGLELAVKPVFLPHNHPLAGVSGPFNAISIYGKCCRTYNVLRTRSRRQSYSFGCSFRFLAIAAGTWPLFFLL